MIKRFITRGIVMTSGVNASIKREEFNSMELLQLVERHFANDGDECKEDKEMNEYAIKHKDGRVFSSFKNFHGKTMFIITDGLHLANDPKYGMNYPHTTIMYAEEY